MAAAGAPATAAQAPAGRISGRRTAPAERELEASELGDHLDRLYRAAWAMCGSPTEAEDLVQETYARVLQRRRVLKNGDGLGYLLRALRNTYVSSLRARDARPQTVALPHPLEVPDGRSVEPAPASEAQAVLSAVAELPPGLRQAVVAVDVLGLSYAEAARALRVRPGTISSRLYRARAQLARRLEQ